MRFFALLLAAVLGLLGVVFVVGNQGLPMRIVVGVILLAAAGALVWMGYLRPRPASTTVVQKLDLSGDVNLQNLTCRSCGASLSQKSLKVEAGAVFVHCEYCAAAYQLEEQPKW